MAAERAQPAVEQREMHRFVGRDADPVIDEAARKLAAEAADEIDGEVDSDKLDMRERVEHRDPAAFRPALAPPRHLRGRKQLGLLGPSGLIGHRDVAAVCERSAPPAPRERARRAALVVRVRRQQDRTRGIAQRRWHQSAFAASSTASAWPFTRTLRHSFASLPSRSKRKVERSMPI